jgi:hypothetical protein
MRELARRLTEFSASLPLVAFCTVVGVDGLGFEAITQALRTWRRRRAGLGSWRRITPGRRQRSAT